MMPTPEEARRQLRIFTAEPHLAGSERNNELARYIANEWKKQGLEDVVLRRYDVFSSEPKETMLEMVAPTHYRATLRGHRGTRIPTQEPEHPARLGSECPNPATSPRR